MMPGTSETNPNGDFFVYSKTYFWAFLLQVADVGDYATIARAIREAVAWRPIDVLICNAGWGQCGYFEDIPLQDVNTLVQTNLLGSVYAVHAALPFLKQQSSCNHPVSIVFMGSLASLVNIELMT
jgi:3-dehydrosphinganine reductase